MVGSNIRKLSSAPIRGSATVFHFLRGALREMVLDGRISQLRYRTKLAQLQDAIKTHGLALMDNRGALTAILEAEDLVTYGDKYLKRKRAMGGLFSKERDRLKAVKHVRQSLKSLKREPS